MRVPLGSPLLTHPALTGTSRAAYHALQARIAVPYADRILATVLSQRKLCSLETLAELFGVSRGTIRTAMYDVLPLFNEDGFTATPSLQRFSTAAEIRAFAADAPELPR